MPIRGLITSSEIDPADIERAIRRASELGVELTLDSAADTGELLDVLARHPDTEVILGDFLPNVPGVDTTYAFGATGGDDATDEAAEQEVLARIPRLRWVQLPSVGVNQEHSSVTWRRAPQVAVTNASGLASTAMAQYVTASILYHAHRLWLLPEYGRLRDWSVRSAFKPEILVGRTLGLLGYGGVGRRAAHIAHGLGMRVRAVRREPGRSPSEQFRVPEIEALDSGPEPAEIRSVDELDWLLPQAEFFVAAVPLTDETRGIIGARELALLPQRAIVINVGRGPLIDEQALIEALQSGHLGGASLDVFDPEPLPAESPLWELPNVMVTPHVSGTHDRVSRYTTDLFLENLARYVSDRPLLNEAKRDRGY
jgi:phosphoglycerate dehydrogenase-like enzyme